MTHCGESPGWECCPVVAHLSSDGPADGKSVCPGDCVDVVPAEGSGEAVHAALGVENSDWC